MRRLLILTILSCCLSCSTINSVIISTAEIGHVYSDEESVPDSIDISSLNLDTIPYILDKEKKAIIFSRVKINQVILAKPVNDSLIVNPKVQNINIKHVTFIDANKRRFRISSIQLLNYSLDSFTINKKTIWYDDNKIRDDSLNQKYQFVKNELDTIESEIEKRILLEPDGCWKQFKQSPYFQGIKNDLAEVLNYIKQPNHVASISEEKIDKLRHIQLQLGFINKELKNVSNAPVSFSSDVFFDPGEFEISSIKGKDVLDTYINTLINYIDTLTDRNAIIITLRTTGYTDDIDVLPGLAQKLTAFNHSTECKGLDSDVQICLNQLLSEQRALSVQNYITSTIEDYFKGKSLSVKIEKESVGKGKENLKNICHGNCPDRRTVVVARIAQ